MFNIMRLAPVYAQGGPQPWHRCSTLAQQWNGKEGATLAQQWNGERSRIGGIPLQRAVLHKEAELSTNSETGITHGEREVYYAQHASLSPKDRRRLCAACLPLSTPLGIPCIYTCYTPWGIPTWEVYTLPPEVYPPERYIPTLRYTQVYTTLCTPWGIPGFNTSLCPFVGEIHERKGLPRALLTRFTVGRIPSMLPLTLLGENDAQRGLLPPKTRFTVGLE